MHINRKQILESFLDNVYRISNKEYQKRIWVEGRGPECHSFDEAVCDFFGDGDPIIECYKEFGVTEDQYQLLKKFRDKFRIFCDSDNSYWEPDFIDTPEWTSIIEEAQEILAAFHYQKKSLKI